ncbi:MAG: glycosyltransferase, partial [Ignavibacteria bacterium]|nr:glycosyltransferase [Ignavibacteria bacterium]
EGCVNSVLKHLKEELDNYEVIVIDNASRDGSLEWLKAQKNIRLIENKENLGYAVACNQGIKSATGKHLLFLGSDTLMQEGTITECLKFLNRNPQAAVVSCRLLNPDGTTQNSVKRFPELHNAIFTYLSLDFLNKKYDMAEFNYNRTTEVEQADGTFLMVRKNVINEIGGFDEQYKILYNDVDFCKRIRMKGHKIYFLHTCSIIHYGSRSTQKAGFRLRKIMYGDIYRYYRNNFGLKAKLLYPILVFRLLIVSTIKA